MIIDIHTHAEGHFYSKEQSVGELDWINRHLIPNHPYISREKVHDYYYHFDPERYLKEYDEAGVDKIVILTDNHKHVYENFIKKVPDRYLAFAGVEPFNQFRQFRRKSVEELEYAVNNYGFRGLGEIATPYQNYSPSDRKLYPLFEKCAELDVPVISHVASTPFPTSASIEWGRPVLLEPAADDFPDVNFCACHMGYPWTEELMGLMDKRANVWTDVAHLCVHRFMLAWYLVMAKDYKVLDRVMFGTDSTCRPLINYINWFKVTLNEICQRTGWPTFTNEEIYGILGENAVKFLKLK